MQGRDASPPSMVGAHNWNEAAACATHSTVLCSAAAQAGDRCAQLCGTFDSWSAGPLYIVYFTTTSRRIRNGTSCQWHSTQAVSTLVSPGARTGCAVERRSGRRALRCRPGEGSSRCPVLVSHQSNVNSSHRHNHASAAGLLPAQACVCAAPVLGRCCPPPASLLPRATVAHMVLQHAAAGLALADTCLPMNVSHG